MATPITDDFTPQVQQGQGYFAALPVLTDSVDAFQKHDQEHTGSLYEAGEIWMPAAKYTNIQVPRFHLAATTPYVGSGVGQFFLNSFRFDDDPNSLSLLEFTIGLFNPNQSNNIVFGVNAHDGTGYAQPGQNTYLFMDTGIFHTTVGTADTAFNKYPIAAFQFGMIDNTGAFFPSGSSVDEFALHYFPVASDLNYIEIVPFNSTGYRSGGSPATVGFSAPELVKAFYAQPGTTLTLSTTLTDVSGATITIPCLGKRNIFVAMASFDMTGTTLGYGTMIGTLSADGVSQAAGALAAFGTAGERATITQSWVVTGLAPGDRIFKLQGKKTVAAGAASIGDNTTLTVIRLAA